MSKISTKLLDSKNDADYRQRKTAIGNAWRTWLHGIIEAMNEQRQREHLTPDMLMSDELGALLAEFEHCQEVGGALLGPPVPEPREE